MAAVTYTQCRLRRLGAVHVAWIPKSFAVLGKRVVIDEYEGTWTVEACFETWSRERLDAQRGESRDFRGVLGRV